MKEQRVRKVLKKPLDEANLEYDESWISEIVEIVMDPSSLKNGAFGGCYTRYKQDLIELFQAAVGIKYCSVEEREVYIRAFDKIYVQLRRRGPPTCETCHICDSEAEEEEFEDESYSGDEMPF